MKKQAPADLLALIRSMSKAEKRAFRLHSARYKTGDAQKSYLQLYERLSRLPLDAPVPEIKGAEQEYLFELLLDSLVQQQGRNTPEIALREQLSSVTVLHRRGLEKKAFRVLDKLLHTAWETGLYEFGLEVIAVHMQLLTSIEQLGTLRVLAVERRKLLDALQLYHRYDELMLELFSQLPAGNRARLRELLRSPLMKKLPPDIRTQVQYHHIAAHAGIGLNDHALTEKHHDAIQRLFETHPAFLNLRIQLYITNVLNSGLLAYQVRKKARLKEAIEKLRQLPKKVAGVIPTLDHDRLKRYGLDLEMRCFLLHENYTACLALLPELKQVISRDQHLELHRANYFRLFSGIALYHLHRYKEALQWLQPVIDNRKQGYYNQKTYSLSYLLRAACHFRLGNEDIGDALLLGFQRNKFFASVRKQEQIERLVKAIRKGYEGADWLL